MTASTMTSECQSTVAQTVRMLEPHFDRLGMTRVGEITGLDTIGIPVWFCCRPNGRGLAVAQGKGMTPEHARLSAIMESLEGAVAEQTEHLTCLMGSIGEVTATHKVVPLQSIMRCRPERLDSDRPRRWAKGYSLVTGEEHLAPIELVGLDIRASRELDHRSMRITSVGLAAGIHVAQCLRHALFELVENDATALYEIYPKTIAQTPVIRPIGILNPDLRALVERVDAAGASPIFRDFSSDIRLPVIAAIIPMPDHRPDHSRYAAGFACREDPEEAALAALLEAVQSRLTEISGARDDLSADIYHASHPYAAMAARDSAVLAFSELRELHPSACMDTEAIVRRLREKNINDIFAFILPTDIPGIHVVRVLATDLDITFDDGPDRIGPRTMKRLFSLYRSP